MTQRSILSLFKSPSSSIPESSSSMFPPILPVEEIDISFNSDDSVKISRAQLEKMVTVQLDELRELRKKLLGSAGGCSQACHDEKVVELSDDSCSEDASSDSMVMDDDNDTVINDDNDGDSMEVDNSGGMVPMHASFAEFAAIFNMGGRDGYVKALAGNPGYTYKSRQRSDYDNDGIIYMILNRRNLKVYVGKTDNVDVRFREHLSGNGGARVLQRAIAKDGPHNFVCVILLAGIQGQTELASAEIAAIEHLDCLTTGKRGYNIQLGGEGGKHAPETKAAISAARKLWYASRTPDEKAAIIAARKERHASRTPEEKAAISAAFSAAMKLSHASRTAEEKAATSVAISVARKERHALQTAEEKVVLSAKLSAVQKKRHASRTPEEKAATSAALKLSHASRTPEEKAAISAAISAALKEKYARAVIITLLVTRVEIQCTSLTSAMTEMGVSRQIISKLVNKTTKKSTSKGGQYAGQLFTARYRDE